MLMALVLPTLMDTQRKKSVLYVGRISKECTEKQIEEFVLRRAVTIGERTPTVYAIRIFSKPGSDYDAARLTIDASSRPLLLYRNFWPRPIYSRAWNFEVYRTDQPGEEARQDATKDVEILPVPGSVNDFGQCDQSYPSLSALLNEKSASSAKETL